jgi:hypothetical protein
MPLSQTQRAVWEKARSLGSGGQAVKLTDEACAYLIARVAADIGVLQHFPELDAEILPFFYDGVLSALQVPNVNPFALYERLLEVNKDGDMYFACLASLHKARLKYDYIVESQPVPTLEQVGPRGLLHYGKLSPHGLVGFLLWRKWFFDIDNRAGQETGYLFEPVIANAIGGTPVPASRSPVKRLRDNTKGRQIDCLLGDKAYEIKIRMTIAASGQGRWGEELDYPTDCRNSGFTPVLVVLDSTPNPKLRELTKAFLNQKGDVYVGSQAWEHLETLAGGTMSLFLENYIRTPLNRLLNEPFSQLPELKAWVEGDSMYISIENECIRIPRKVSGVPETARDQTPDDALTNGV